VYVRFGDVIGWASVVAAIVGVYISIRRGKRRSPASPGPSISAAGSAALLTAALAGPLASPLRAQARPDSAARAAARDTLIFNLEDLRVRATRPLATTSGASAVRLSLLSPRLEPVPLLEDALRAMPFVQVRENSRGEAQVTLRGTGSRQVAVFVDGVPLSLGWDARTDLSVIPTDAAREVELFRGIPSVLHGPNVLGGVVEIDLASGRMGAEPPRSGIQGGFDETGATVFGGRFGKVHDLGSGRLSVQAGVGRRTRDGVTLPRGVVQPAEGDHGKRLNSDFDHTSGFLAARYEAPSGAWASLSSFAYRAERGVPPELHLSNPRRWRIPEIARVVTAVTAGTAWGETPLGEGDVEVSLGLDVGDTRIDAYQTLAYETITDRQFSDTRTITARAVADHTLGAGILRSAFTWAQTDHDERVEDALSSPVSAPTRSFTQRVYSLGAELEHPVTTATSGFWSGVRLTAGASFDHAATPRTGGVQPRGPIGAWGARVGASALIGDRGRAHMGVSRRVRFPSLRELYSGALGRFVPNPGLDPEVLRTLEAGVTGTLDAFSGELEGQAVLFYQRFSDAIVRTGLGGGRFRRENRNRVGAGGLELLAAWSLNRWSLGGDVTWQNVTLTDDLAPAVQRRAEYQPEIAGSVNLSGPVFADVIGRAEVEMVGRQFCVDPELERDVALEGTARLDLLVSREWRIGAPFRRLQATAALHNVTDAAVFDQCGLPQPGRLFRAQFRIF